MTDCRSTENATRFAKKSLIADVRMRGPQQQELLWPPFSATSLGVAIGRVTSCNLVDSATELSVWAGAEVD